MRSIVKWPALALCATLGTGLAQAQTAGEVVEKHLAALGGRAALAKLTSQVAKGTITASVQGADLAGTIEVYNKAPNKMRVFMRFDLSAMGAGEMTIDQRCDGRTAFTSNSMQGDREITGTELQSMLNDTFPTPLLDYKGAGVTVELAGKETVGDRTALVLLITPKAGPPTRQFIDAETYLLLRSVTTTNSPEAGGDVQQTTDAGDYRTVDGVKVPFRMTIHTAMQLITVTLSAVEINAPIDDATFARPSIK